MLTSLTYESVAKQLADNHLSIDPSEVHGILCGLLCGGMGHGDDQWVVVLSDIFNHEEAFNVPSKKLLTDLFNQCCQQLIEGQFALELMLPDDDEPINQRGIALIEWVQGFMLGFGLQQDDLTKCSEEVKEALNDFADIARMEEPMDDDDDSERALTEVVEYVRMSAMFCFSELGKSLLDDAPHSPSVH